jgi:hypothetical protein
MRRPFHSTEARVGDLNDMGDAWFTSCDDELARVLADARDCAEACERYLGTADAARLDADMRTLAPPAAVSRVLIDLIDQPAELVLAVVRLCRDLTFAAAEQLAGPPEVVAALRTVAGSAAALLDATG